MAQKLKNGDGNVSVVFSKVVALIKLANSTTYGLKSWRFTAPKLEETQYPIHIEPDTTFQGSLLLSFVIY